MTDRGAYITAIGTAVPGHDVHQAFIDWASRRMETPRERDLFGRLAARAGIAHRWSVLDRTSDGGSPVDPGGFYAGDPPSTAARMALYARAAPGLARAAIAALAEKADLDGITHLVVASCTGFMAPGLDQVIAAELGLDTGVERTLVGFMGCYAAVSALRVAHHIVRADPAARVLVVAVELSTLHLQEERAMGPLLAMLQFGDGASAALVSAWPSGLGMSRFFAVTLPDSAELIRWTIGDSGFAMHLAAELPERIRAALGEPALSARLLAGLPLEAVDGWAVHPGGRSVLDAVEKGLGLPPRALAASRSVLARHGNMSSATLLFVLADLMTAPDTRHGIALAFGPGLAVEGFHFARAG